tara:strand:- start:26 stop:427 length:402 start_codon:yes stop_codon:yes gene_type:complete
MAFGNLKFDTLTTSDSIVTNTEKSINTSYVLNGSAKVWQRHNASHTLASGSLNCSSVTDTATGIATITYTNALSAATQVVVAGSGNEGTDVCVVENIAGSAHTTTTHRYTIGNASFNDADRAVNGSVVFGDLA